GRTTARWSSGWKALAASGPSAPTTAAPPGTPPCRSRPTRPTQSPGYVPRHCPPPRSTATAGSTSHRRTTASNPAAPPTTSCSATRPPPPPRRRHAAHGATCAAGRGVPLIPGGSNVDHFIPGLAVNRTSAGGHAQLALTYYFDTNPSCSGSACQIQVGFASSLDNGQAWSTPHILS